MAKKQRERLKRLVGKVLDLKQDKPTYLAGQLGIYKDGSKIIKVPNRPGFVYVRIGGNHSEVIEAVNGAVQEIWDLKVLITKPDSSPDTYIVVGRDYSQYSSWPSNTGYLPKHGHSHSFGNGSDPVFIYKKQLAQPLQPHPTNPRTMKLRVEPDFYIWDNEIKYFHGGNTVDLTNAKPTTATNGRYVTIYLDGDANALGVVTGTEFSIFPFQATGTLLHIPEVNPSDGIPLAAVLLTTGTSNIGWDDFKDIRHFLGGGGGSYPTVHGLDPSAGFHTGSLTSTFVSIVDPQNYFTGTFLDDVLNELYRFITGKAPFIHGLDPSAGFHTGGLSASFVTVVDAAGHFVGNDVEEVLQEIGESLSGVGTGSVGHLHGVTRASITSGTSQIELLDFAEQLEFVSFNGFVVDPLGYSLSSGSDYLLLNNPVVVDGIVTVNYIIKQE